MVRNRESSSRIAKWEAELAEYTIEFVPKTTIKSHILADWTLGPKIVTALIPPKVWEIQCDGAYCDKCVGASVVITSPLGLKLRYAARLDNLGHTNNTVEYEGLLLGLRKAKALGTRRVIINTNFGLKARHNDKTYKARKLELAEYLIAV